MWEERALTHVRLLNKLHKSKFRLPGSEKKIPIYNCCSQRKAGYSDLSEVLNIFDTMEQESIKTPTSCKRCFPWERIRSLLCFALVICLFTCMAFQFIFLVSMHRQLEQAETQLRENTKMCSQWERRLTISENEIKAISQTLKHRKWEIKTNRARQKRTNSPQVNFSALDKRVIAVESRYYSTL